MTVYQRLNVLGLRLPEPPIPQGHYTSVIIHQQVATISGQVSRIGNHVIVGPVGDETPKELVKQAAEACVLRALSALEQQLGSLLYIDRILFVRGFIWSTLEFNQYSQVLDHASCLLTNLFGERGVHARSALGVSGLPAHGMIELELVASLKTE